MRTHRRNRYPSVAAFSLLTIMALPTLAAESALRDEAVDQQQQQQAIQARIDQADDDTRSLLNRLRDAQSSAQRLERYNQQLSSTLDQQQQRIERQRHALTTLDDTREALPTMLDDMLIRLRALVEADMPFRRDERIARLDSLERTITDTSQSYNERLKQVLSTWQTELDYGQQMDSWRGRLTRDGQESDVQYLRMGRVGFYYLTPDGEQGGVWKESDRQWHALDSAERREVGLGIRIANDQRSPELLSLPLSVDVQSDQQTENGASS